MYRLLEEERKKLEEEKRHHAETKRLLGLLEKENMDLKAQLAKEVKQPIPTHTRREVRKRYKLIKEKENLELDLHVSVDHPDNKSILDRVVRGAMCSKYPVVEADAVRAAKDMFINLRDDRCRVVNGKKGAQLKSVRRRNRMVQKQNTRKTAFNSKHCKLSVEDRSMASIMFSKDMEYISSEEDENVTEETESGKRTVRNVRILPFENESFKRIKLSLDETHRNDITPEWRRDQLIVLVKDPSVCQISQRKLPSNAPHWAVNI